MGTVSAAVGANIRAEMARRLAPQSALSAALGLSQSGVSKRLRGVTPMTIDEISSVAAWLEVPIASLLPETPPLSLADTG